MLSKEKTIEILNRFSQECYEFWRREGKSHKEAFETMLKEIETTKCDPYEPYGGKLNPEGKSEFLKKERSI